MKINYSKMRDDLLRQRKMNKMKTCGIYRISNLSYNKHYIGQSLDIENRWYAHKRDLQNYSHANDRLQQDWTMYGESDFEFEILEISNDPLVLSAKEKYWINFYQKDSEIYNINNTSNYRELKLPSEMSTISDFVDYKRIEQERSLSWLADKLQVSYQTLRSRFKADNLLATDVLTAAEVLNFDLNELKQLFKEE